MIDLFNSTFSRLIIHRIHIKKRNDKNASVEFSNDIILPSVDVLDKLKERINEAFGKGSKSFLAEIADCSDKSFFDYAHDIFGSTAEIFVEKSKNIAQKIAESQTSSRIPGGFLVLIETISPENENAIIVIKAELHEAFRTSEDKTKIELLTDIFLSPAVKFFKIGVLYKSINIGKTYPNDSYSALIFDDQFLANSDEPAEYFYKKFLRYNLDNNEKLLTKEFYNKFIALIESDDMEYQEKQDMINLIKSLYKMDRTGIVNPTEIGEKFLKGDFRKKYTTEILSVFSRSFKKDTTLLDFSLKQQKMYFNDNVKLIGLEEHFKSNVEIIDTEEELEMAFDNRRDYTILKIKGKPHFFNFK
jgi:37-kD nucleoid-associated bacterial protein